MPATAENPNTPRSRRGIRLTLRRRSLGKHAEEGHELSELGGLAALSLDALSSVAYGPEAMVLVLVAAGAGALSATVPLTLVIAERRALLSGSTSFGRRNRFES